MNQALTLPGIGDLIDGRFRIDRKLGEGGSSTVYQVSHIITDKKFAIKWLLPELALDEAAVDRFIHEARVGGKFAHPYAVQVYDICKANDSFYMLMELLEGESLQTRLERMGRLPVQSAARIVNTCCEVIAAAHRAGIIHRDLKPANIFLCAAGAGSSGSDEVPKLLDFGISTFCVDLHSSTSSAAAAGAGVIGTPLYMAPEQMLGQVADQRTDIYAIGAMLYELVSGNPPYQAETYTDLARKVTFDARAIPLDEQLSVEPEFAAIVAKAMARDPADRYGSVTELMQALAPYTRARAGLAKRRDASARLITDRDASARSITDRDASARSITDRDASARSIIRRGASARSNTGLARVPAAFTARVEIVDEVRGKRWPRAAIALAGMLGVALIVGWGANELQVAPPNTVARTENMLRPRALADNAHAIDELPEMVAHEVVSNAFAMKQPRQALRGHQVGQTSSVTQPAPLLSASATPRSAPRPKRAVPSAVVPAAPTDKAAREVTRPSTPAIREGGPLGVSIKRSDFSTASEHPAPMPTSALSRKDF